MATNSQAAPAKPGVVADSGAFSKIVWWKNPATGTVTDVVFRQLDGKPGPDWGIAGKSGFELQSTTGKVIRSGAFPSPASFVEFIDIEGDGRCEFLDRGGHGWADAHVYDHKGALLWTSAGPDATDDMAAGDMNGDGKTEFVIGHNGGAGVQLRDSKGKQRWIVPDGNVWNVEMVDTNGDGRKEIVHSNARGQLTVRDATGKVLTQAKINGHYFSKFDVCRYPSAKAAQRLLSGGNGTIYILDFKGKILKQLNAPQFPQISDIHGIPVQLRAGQPSHFAVISNYSPTDSGVLYIFDGKGTLIYQENFSETLGALATKPATGGTETLLVGGNGQVWEYQ